MGSTFVTINNEHGFWMNDGILELFLRLSALHIPEPKDTDSPAKQAAAKELRDQWLLASSGGFVGCVPVGLKKAFATNEGKGAALVATRSLLRALEKGPPILDADTLNLLGFEEGIPPDIRSAQLMEVAKAFLDLYDGKITSTASDSSSMPGGWR